MTESIPFTRSIAEGFHLSQNHDTLLPSPPSQAAETKRGQGQTVRFLRILVHLFDKNPSLNAPMASAHPGTHVRCCSNQPQRRNSHTKAQKPHHYKCA